MLYYTGTGDIIVVPSEICGLAELGLAHYQMQRHLPCRIDLCAWKWVAYCTLIHYGRVVPPESTVRERAHQRGIPVPPGNAECAGSNPEVPDPQTFQQVLDGLTKLAQDMRDPRDGCDQ